MKINDFFDKGFYINLDRRVDRNSQFIQELKNKIPIEFLSRISGVDSSICSNISYKHYFCSVAFYHIIAKSYSLGYNKIVIFEDDFKFYDTEEYKGIENIEKSLDQLLNIGFWDILYFGGYARGNTHKISENIIQVNTILAMHGVGISKLGMEKILNYYPFKDSALDSWISDNKDIVKYLVYPMSSYQKSNYSDLDAFGNTPNLEHWKNNYIVEDL